MHGFDGVVYFPLVWRFIIQSHDAITFSEIYTVDGLRLVKLVRLSLPCVRVRDALEIR